jgi:protein-disulfide isomerase/uncharacterized membrane protein
VKREETNSDARMRRRGLHGWMVAGALFALAGLVASGIAWRTHWQVRNSPPSFRPACSVSETVDCAKAARSDFAVFLRVPIALWSACGFIALLVFALLGLRREPEGAFASGLFFAFAAAAAAVSVAMALVARLLLQVLCPECTVIQVLSVAVFVCAALQLRDLHSGPVAALAADLRVLRARSSATVSVVALGVLVVVLLIALYPQHRWRAPAMPGLPVNVPAGDLTGPAGVPTGTTDDGHPYIGAAAPVVTIVEYSDYQCPFCRHAHSALREIVRRHAARIRLVHIQFPLDQSCNPALPKPFHKQACELARAACCAEQQGLFWEMNDRLFARQDPHGTLDATVLARDIGVADPAAFHACLDGAAGRDPVQRDVVLGVQMLTGAGFGAGTPAFELRDASGTVFGRYLGVGGAQGMPEDVLRRLDAGWPEEPGDARPPDGR